MSRFCPGSARGRHLMGFDEDRSANLSMSAVLCYGCSQLCDLTRPSSRRRDLLRAAGVCPPELEIFLLSIYASTAALPAANSVPSTNIRCRITASFRASATFALRMPARLATRIAQLFSDEPLTGLVRMTLAAS